MRIDGYSPAYVPNRSSRPDVTEVYDHIQRQQQARADEQQVAAISANVRTDSDKAVPQLSSESTMLQAYEQNQARQQLHVRSDGHLPYQVSKALNSYNQTASYTQTEEASASQVLGLDLYA